VALVLLATHRRLLIARIHDVTVGPDLQRAMKGHLLLGGTEEQQVAE